jgi:hypothetical protein
MRPAQALNALMDRLEHGETRVGLATRSVAGLGRMLCIEIRHAGRVFGLYPAPCADAEQAALLLRDCPVPPEVPECHSKALICEGSCWGLDVCLDGDAVLVTHPAWGAIVRHPVVRGYLEGAGGLGGVVTRVCGSCGCERPLREFFAEADDPTRLLPECRDHWLGDSELGGEPTGACIKEVPPR